MVQLLPSYNCDRTFSRAQGVEEEVFGILRPTMPREIGLHDRATGPQVSLDCLQVLQCSAGEEAPQSFSRIYKGVRNYGSKVRRALAQ